MLENEVKRLAQSPNFGALTTLLPSGQPMTQVMWVDADDDHILITSERVILRIAPRRQRVQ